MHVIETLQKGIPVDDLVLHASRVSDGRFQGERNLDLHVRSGDSDAFLMYAKVFHGASPEYRPWVELFAIQPSLELEGQTVPYFDSDLENELLRRFSGGIGPRGTLFVEYASDRETLSMVHVGAPVPLTRLGGRLLRLGFTWFKVWYFPEGGSEGSEKIQAERPIDGEAESRHRERMREETARFLETSARGIENREFMDRVRVRAENLLQTDGTGR
jgi:hypothetical protein